MARQDLFGGVNYAFGLTESRTLDENNPNFRFELPTGKGVLACLVRLDATLSIATGEDKVLEEGVARLLENLGVTWNGFSPYPYELSGRDHLRIARRMLEQELDLTEPSDATAQNSTDISVEFPIFFSPPIIGEAAKHMYLGPADERDTFEVQGKFATAKTGTGSDAGTGVVIKDDDSSNNNVTWDSKPTVSLTPVVMPKPAALPYSFVKAHRRVEDTFTGSVDPYKIELTQDTPAMFTLLAATENGSDEDLYDGIDLVTYGDRPDFLRVSYEALSMDERARFPATKQSRTGELGIMHSRGSIGTALVPDQDLQAQQIKLATNSPTGDGKVTAYWFSSARDQFEEGKRVRNSIEIPRQGVVAQARG